MQPYVYGSIIYNSQIMEAVQVLTDRWMDKNVIYMYVCIHTHTHDGILVIKQNGVMPFATIWIDLPEIMLNEIRQRKTNVIWINSCVEIKQIKKWTKEKTPHALKFFSRLFIFEWQSIIRVGTEREGITESEAGSRLQAVNTEPDAGLEPTNHEITTWAEVRRLTDWATQVPPDSSL